MPSARPEVVIPREQAVFRLDGRGRWCNHDGPFRNRRISDHFHASIHRDAGGYHLRQELPDRIEKVYFPYEDTALFVTDVALGTPVRLTLNTRRQLDLDPPALFVHGDSLYLELEGDRVKFTERAMLTLSEAMESAPGGYALRVGGRVHPIPEREGGPVGCGG